MREDLVAFLARLQQFLLNIVFFIAILLIALNTSASILTRFHHLNYHLGTQLCPVAMDIIVRLEIFNEEMNIITDCDDTDSLRGVIGLKFI
jgi:hypothetical protein